MSDLTKTLVALTVGGAVGAIGATILNEKLKTKASRNLPKLYTYEHCPYCVRVRMILGWKNIKHELIFVAADDMDTPINLIGVKKVPIFEIPGKLKPMGESLDIIQYVDKHLGGPPILKQSSVSPGIQKWIQDTAPVFRRLYHPRYAMAPFAEFAQLGGREFYRKKKESAIGPFSEAIDKTPEFVAKTNQYLIELEPLLPRDIVSKDEASFDDIHLFPVLRNLTIVKDVKWPPKVREYLQCISAETDICLLTSMATI